MARDRATGSGAGTERSTTPADPPVGWLDEEPLVLVGTPQALRGELRVTNRGGERVSLRRGRLTATGDAAGALTARAADEAGDAPVRLARVRSFSLRAGEHRTVPLSVDLGPHAPPGEYQAEVEVGGLRRLVTLQVLARPSLVATPRRVVVPNRPGEATSVRIALRNAGNVPLTVAEVGAVVLDDDVLECRILRRALAEFDDETDDYTDFLTEVVRQAKRTLDEAGLLRVANRSGETRLAPGATALVDLEITVPSSADRHARYTGSIALGDTHVGVVVVPATAVPS